MNKPHILLVDDEAAIRATIEEFLLDDGFHVSQAENVATARLAKQDQKPDLIVLDIWMPDGNGVELLREWSAAGELDIPVIMLSGHGNIDTAVETLQLGAYSFVEKPVSYAKLMVTINNALETAALKRENRALKQQLTPASEPVGTSRTLEKLKQTAARIAQHGDAVLISGESGTGKELFARYLHQLSPRAGAALVTLNLTAADKDSIDETLFAALAQAQGGTLLLKEVADLPLDTQARLHLALETQTLAGADGSTTPLDVRVIATTRQDLKTLVRAKTFRDDLFYLLSVVPLTIPPLREHSEDIAPLIQHFMSLAAARDGMSMRQISHASLYRLRQYEWHGNVRELRNLMQRLLIMTSGHIVEVPEVEAALGWQPPQPAAKPRGGNNYDLPYRDARDDFDRTYLEYQLRTEEGNISRVAEKIGLERTHLHRKMKTLGIEAKYTKPAK